MPPNWTLLPGLLARGYRVASGPSRDYPYGALEVLLKCKSVRAKVWRS